VSYNVLRISLASSCQLHLINQKTRLSLTVNNNMDQSITLNSKVFSVTSRPSASSAILTTRSRGVSLPDSLLVAHRTQPNSSETGTRDAIHQTSIQRTYITAGGISKTIQFSLNSRIPDDADDTNVAAALADLTDYMASAVTLRAANIAAHTNGETP
jgi:hypothetical protein